MRNNLKKKAALSGTMILASMGIFSPAISSVYAGDTGGGNGNGVCIGTCESALPFSWRYVSSNGSGSAWTKFAGPAMNSWGNNGLYRGYTEGHAFQYIHPYGMTNAQLLQACKNSKTIWWVTSSRPWTQGKTNGWLWNGSVKSYPATTSGYSFDNAVSIANSSMDPNIKAAAKKWIESSVPSGKINVVCSAVFNNGSNPNNPGNNPTPTPSNGTTPPPAVQTRTRTETVPENRTHDRVGSSQIWNMPYAYITQISRQISQNGIDPIGKNNLHGQTNNQKTAFAALYDDIEKNTAKYNGYTPAQIKDLVDQALAKDKIAGHASVNLDKKNKDGLAEGGVLNINQLTRNATIAATQTVTEQQTRTCTVTTTETFDNASNSWVVSKAPQRTCGKWATTSSTSSMTAETQMDATPEQSAFWQMLSVHCNKGQFEALVKNAPGAKVINTGDASKALSAVAYSKTYKEQPAFLDFGDANNPNKALSASASLGFYDKECPFDCRSNPTGQGASSQNGASKNVGDSKPAGNGAKVGRYGAISGVNNDSKFTFFRDNMKHLISTDVWYPASSGVVHYDGAAPLSTTVNRWAEGTPSLDGSNGGKFTMTTADGKQLFTGTDTPTTQKNFSTDTFSNSTSEQVAGLLRAFNVQATWASDKDKPQTFNFKWEYAPTVDTKAMVTGVGFDANDTPQGTAQTLPASIQGKCYAIYGDASKTLDTSDLFAANTGTGTKNNIDGGLLDGANNEAANLYVNFVRSTTE